MKFVLMPDALSASTFRSVLAEKNTVGVKVGTFSSLMESLAIYWILPQINDDFELLVKTNAIKLTLKSDNDAFWSKSIKVDEIAALSEVSSSLKLLLAALPLDKKLIHLHEPKTRIEKYYNDLVNLHIAMEHVRPLEQMQAMQWLSVADSDAIEPLELIYLSALFSFEPWQRQLIKKLEEKTNLTNADDISNAFQLLIDLVETNNHRSADLKDVSQFLFELPNVKESKETDTIHWLACRDSLQEVEVVVGMVQKALELGTGLNEMALVIPHHAEYLKSLPVVLNKAGILTSNRHAYSSAFQWDIQLVKDLLVFYEQKINESSIVSPMSLAAIFTNPLMPWSKSKGQNYAVQCFKGTLEEKLKEFKSENIENSDKNVSLIAQIVHSDELWHDWLIAIIEKLNFPKDTRFGSLKSMRLTIKSLMESSSSYINPKDLINRTDLINQTDLTDQTEQLKRLIKEIEPTDVDLELERSGTVLNGLLVLTENEWLLKPVKHLFVVGFNQGCYTQASNAKNVFGDAGLQSLESQLELHFDNSARRQSRFQERMKMMFSKTEKSVIFLLSEQSLSGDNIHPSEMLLDMALCFQNIDEVNPDKLIESLTSCSVNYLENVLPFFKQLSNQSVNAASGSLNKQSSSFEPQDLNFDFDLLKLHLDKDGNQRRESPSSLEKMMISPLAWLLNRQGLEPKAWAVQELGVALKGSIAHKVFELHFDKNSALTVDAYDKLYIAALESDAPFMLMPQWRLEHTQLKHEIKKSLLPFIKWCEQEGWSVTDTEMELTGDLWGLAMRGFADSILSKDNESLILDYKKSSSKSRVQRLENGYDLQTVIYRELFKQKNSAKKQDIHSGYYTLNDSKLVLDNYAETSVEGISQVKLNVEIKQQSIEAIKRVKQRIKQLKQGKVELNQQGDTDLWNSLGINATYSIDETALVGHFIKTAQESDDE